MPINAKVPLIKPAMELDKLWILRLTLNAPVVGGEATGDVVVVPYNDTGAIDYSQSRVLKFHEIMAAIEAGDVEMTNVFVAILAAVQKKEDAS